LVFFLEVLFILADILYKRRIYSQNISNLKLNVNLNKASCKLVKCRKDLDQNCDNLLLASHKCDIIDGSIFQEVPIRADVFIITVNQETKVTVTLKFCQLSNEHQNFKN
jgi:hypothetical protein